MKEGSSPDRQRVRPTGYWTFFCNPARWDVASFLAGRPTFDTYMITSWQSKWFRPGQMGLLKVGIDSRRTDKRVGGRRLESGVYAIVEVASEPAVMPSTVDKYWLDDADRQAQRLRVRIRYDTNMLDAPITTAQLKRLPAAAADPYLARGFQASSMPLRADAFRVVLDRVRASDAERVPPPVERAQSDEDVLALEQRYTDAVPEIRERVSKVIERGPAADIAKQAAGRRCMVCSAMHQSPLSFLEPNGQPYIEAHHVVPVSTRRPGVLGIRNVIAVCAHHHRQLHYGNSQLVSSTESHFVFCIDGLEVEVMRIETPAS
jgi:hypothetical protein